MSEDTGKKSPKTLADVSHLFFSGGEEHPHAPAAGPEPSSSREGGTGAALLTDPSEDSGRWHRTTLFVVTGADGSPGKSTVAINLAHALMSRGRVGIVDADPKLPNARFYLGLPSWHYLSPVTGEGRSAPNTLSDSGLVVVDRAAGGGGPGDLVGSGGVAYVDVSGGGRVPLHHLVFDLPAARASWIAPVAGRVGLYVVVARAGRAGFEETYAALSTLRMGLGIERVGLILNMVRSSSDAGEAAEKIETAARRLLSLDVRFLGGVVLQPRLGSEQRERGAIVRSRPDAVAALQLREVSSRALEIAVGP